MADEEVAEIDEQTDPEADAADAPPPEPEAADATGDDAEAPAAEEADEPPGDDLSDFPGEDVDDIEVAPKGGNKRRLIMFGGAGLAGVLVLAGAFYFIFFSGGDEPAQQSKAVAAAQDQDDSPVPRVKLSLPPKRQARAPARETRRPGAAPQHAMTPPMPGPGGATAMTRPPAGTPPQGAAPGAKANAAAGAKAPAAAQSPGTLNTIAATAVTPGAGVIIPASTETSFASIPVRPKDDALPPAPDPALLQDSPGGALPRIGTDGRQPWQVYARPFQRTTTNTPNIAIVITELGLSAAATQAAIDKLPPDVTLAFSPYAKGLQTWLISAREAGHEVLLGLPMQPVDFPNSDPGPYMLETDADAADNLDRLRKVLGRGAGYVGVIDEMGSGFAESEAALKPVIEEIRRRGLLYVDSGAAPDTRAPKVAKDFGVPVAVSLAPLDATASPSAIDERLADIEAAARRSGGVLVIGTAHPVTIARIAKWSQDLITKNLRLAPVSAVVKAPEEETKKADAAQH